MAARSTRITLHNESSTRLRLIDSSLDHGEWSDSLRPPDVIDPSSTVHWQSESAGIATGTEGRATYLIDARWQPWFQIHPETVFDHTTQQVTAVARTPDHLDLFVVGFDNAIWSSWWRS